MKTFVFPAVLFLCTLVLGWNLRSHWSPDASKPDDATAISESHRKAPSYRDVIADLERIRGVKSADERVYATFRLVESIPVTDFNKWVDEGWFDSREGFELTLFHRLLEERWQKEDPENFVLWCLSEASSQSKISVGLSSDAALPILKKWAIEEPERLVKLLTENPNPSMASQIVSSLAKLHPETALSLLTQFTKDSTTQDQYRFRQSLTALAESNPELVEKIIPELTNELQSLAVASVSQQRLDKNFDHEIYRLFADSRGMQTARMLTFNAENATKLADMIGQFPASWKDQLKRGGLTNLLSSPESGEAWLNANLEDSGFTFEEASRVRTNAARYLAFQKPGDVLSQLDQLDLTSTDRINLVSSTFGFMAAMNPDSLDKNLALITNPKEIEAAKKMIEINRPKTEE